MYISAASESMAMIVMSGAFKSMNFIYIDTRLRTGVLALLVLVHSIVLFFFFQAEDGIRDYKVTGVQTCALPISQREVFKIALGAQGWVAWHGDSPQFALMWAARATLPHLSSSCLRKAASAWEIGRASCRERV